MNDFARARIEHFPMNDQRCFKLTVRSDSFRLGNDGSLHVWLDRGDACNLQLDCSGALLDSDLADGSVTVKELVG